MKVTTILGTRPEIIRLSEIMKKLDSYVNHVVVYTNQSYDYEMSQIFFDELKIRKPDYIFDVKSSMVSEQIGKIITQTEVVLKEEKPDAILILGDTNSALSCIVAKRMRIPIFHMEAGNRCFDDRVPEEINRRIVDHTSDINICYTEHARRYLLREGLNPQDIYVVGSPLVEVYSVQKDNIYESKILEELNLKQNGYFLASIHREENVNDVNNLTTILKTFGALIQKYKMPVVMSTHPRTDKNIYKLGIKNGKIITHIPFGFFEYVKLQCNAFCTLSDSGTISEDSAILNIPALNIRESSERPETLDRGNIIQTGVNTETIISAVDIVRKQYESGIKFVSPYGTEYCSDKIVRLILGLRKIIQKRKYYV